MDTTSEKLPVFLFGTYKQYKFNTSNFVSWLGETARKSGHTENVPGNDSSKKPKAKKSGKRKKKPRPSKSVISLSQLPELARSIARSKSEVPYSILMSLEQIIRARGDCADWFDGRQADEKVAAANQNHRHAINVFKEVRQILSPISPKPPKEEKPAEDITMKLANRFEGLDVEDPLSDYEDTPTQPKMADKKSAENRQTYEFDDPHTDWFMQSFFFYMDMSKLRLYLNQVWKDYRDGKVDLASASVTTDYALELLQKNEEEFAESLPTVVNEFEVLLLPKTELAEYSSKGLQNPLGSDCYETTGLSLFYNLFGGIPIWKNGSQIDELVKERVAENELHEAEDSIEKLDQMSQSLADVYHPQDLLCVNTWNYLQVYLSLFEHRDDFTIKTWPSSTREIVPSRDRNSLTPLEKIKEDHDILFALLPDLMLLNLASSGSRSVGHSVTFKDKVARGILTTKLCSTRKTPIWLVFGVQMLLDVFHITRYQAGRSLNEVRLVAAKHEKALNAYEEFSKDKNDDDRQPYLVRDGSWSEKKHLSAITEFINDWVHEDRIGKLREIISPRLVRHPFWLLTYHPMLCGAYIFSMNISMQSIGRLISESWKSIPAILHLYNAVVELIPHFDKVSWPDIDAFLSIHGEEYLFYGGKPTTPSGCILKSTMAFVGFIGAGTKYQSKMKGPKRTLYLAPSVSRIFAERYDDCHVNDKVDYARGDNLNVTSLKMLLDKAWEQQNKSPITDEQVPFRYRGIMKRGKRPKDPAKLSPLQLLGALCIALNSEFESLNLDYISLHIRCMKTLRAIHGESHSVLRGWMESMKTDTVPNNWETTDAVLGMMPIYILQHNLEAHEIKVKSGQRGIAIGLSLYQAAQVIEKVAAEEGSVELDKIKHLKEEDEKTRVKFEESKNSERIEMMEKGCVQVEIQIRLERATADPKILRHLSRVGFTPAAPTKNQ